MKLTPAPSHTPNDNLTFSDREPIAIVGIGCRFPGGADSPAAFWSLLNDGVDAMVPVPDGRWDVRRFYDPNPEKPGVAFVHEGGFLREPIDAFDAMFFGISPREAACIDPQQRLLLEVTYEAMEDAGLTTEQLAGSNTGVYIGGFMLDNQLQQMGLLNREIISSHSATSSTLVMLSNRISYVFDLRGPSISIDTACSSSMVALNYACEDLWQGRCSAAIAGGVNIMLRPEYTIVLSKGGFLAPDSRCKSFDERANGYARGEGGGVVVLKPLSAALQDGDQIYALIRATGVNQDGRTNGITVPNGESQVALLRHVYDAAGISAEDLSYIEAHGTGTAIGDPTEAKAFGTVLAEARQTSDPCLIGSVKANIGHLEAAAGIAGVIKAALCLKHRSVPPQIHIQNPNPNIPFKEMCLRLPLKHEPLPDDGRPLLVSVNSFGYGGTNGHALLQGMPSSGIVDTGDETAGEEVALPRVVPISARSPEALAALAQAYLDRLSDQEAGPVTSLEELAYNMGAHRSHHADRMAVVADTIDEFSEKLRAIVAGEQPKGTIANHVQNEHAVRPVFVFTGMGPQWWAMGRELLETEPVFRAAAEAADEAFRRHSGWSILAEMQADEATSRMPSNDIAQPANFVLQVGLEALWRSWGIEPAAIVGHSVGEVTAAYAAGCLNLDEAALVSFQRSTQQQRAAGLGRMMAVGMSAEAATDLLEGFTELVSIAAVNSPSGVTLAGDPDALAVLAEHLTAQGVFNRFLHVEIAYHSPQMEPLKAALLDGLSSLTPKAPTVPLYSTVTGERVEGAIHDADYWWRNVRQPVLFADAASRLAEDGHTLFLEVGPNPVLAGSIKESVRRQGVQAEVLPSLIRNQPERATLMGSLGGLYCQGYAVDWKRIYPNVSRRIQLPRYPWQRETYWVETSTSRMDRLGTDRHMLLGNRLDSPLPVWESNLNINRLPYLDDHKVEGSVVFPGAGYLEAALAAQREIDPEKSGVIESLEFHQALLVGNGDKPCLRVELDAEGRGVAIHSRAGVEGDWKLHVTARLSQATPYPATGPIDLPAIRERCGDTPEVEALYEQFGTNGLQYGPYFQGIRQLCRGPDEVLAQVEAHPELEIDEDYDLLHPTLVDACFQALIAALPPGLYLPVRINRVSVFDKVPARFLTHGRITRRTSHFIDGDIELCDDQGHLLAEIKGLRCQILSTGSRTDETAALDSMTYTYAWERTEAASDATTGTEEDPGRWLIFNDNGGVGNKLTAMMVKRGADCLTICDGPEFKHIGLDEFRLRADSPDDIKRLMELAKPGNCRGIIYLPALNAGDAADPVGQRACVSTLNLVKTLSALGGSQMPRLFIVTQGSHDVGVQAQPPVPAQASVWGFGRVVMNEHSDLRCTLIDIDPDQNLNSLPRLLEEVLSNGHEEEIALRGTDRYVHRLDRVALGSGVDQDAATLRSTAEPFELEIPNPPSFESFRFRTTERREPGTGEVELCIDAVALGTKDVLKMLDRLPDSVTDDSFSGTAAGVEISATVVGVGEGVAGLACGDNIVAMAAGGCLKSYAIVPADQLFWLPRPSRHGIAELAGMVGPFLTALYGLNEVASVQPGERVLVHVDSGGVGLAAIQVARRAGAEILAISGSADDRDYLASIGIRHVMDWQSLSFAAQVMEITGGHGVDVVISRLSGEAREKTLALLAPFGRFIEVSDGTSGQSGTLPFDPAGRSLTIASADVERLLAKRPALARRLLADLQEGIKSGDFQPLPTDVHPVSGLADACRRIEAGGFTGRVAVSLFDEEVAVLPILRTEPLFNPEATYLLTGGFGGFGLEVAKWMADEGARHLVLIGRRGANTEGAPEAIRQLQEKGAEVLAAAVDVTQEDQLKTLFQTIADTMPPLRGIMHAAMVLDDGLIQHLEADRLARVMGPKAVGAWHLHKLTETLPLDFFVMYSSVASLVGNPGQGSYVAANTFLDALAHHRRALGLAATSINWGVLADVGVASRDATLLQHLERVGMKGVSPLQALTALGRVLRTKPVQVGVMHLDWQRWGQTNPMAAHSPRFSRLMEASAASGADDPVVQLLMTMTAEERETEMTVLLAEEIAQVLRMPPAKLDVHQPLSRLGVDSLITVELQIAIQSRFRTEISTLELMKGVGVAQLAQQILIKMNIPATAAPTAAPTAPTATPTAKVLEKETV